MTTFDIVVLTISIVILLGIGTFFIIKVNKYYDDLIANEYKKYTDHIDDWYYEIIAELEE